MWLHFFVGCPAGLGKVFLACKNKKQLNFLRSIDLWPEAQLSWDLKKRNWILLLFHFFELVNVVSLIFGSSFFIITSGFGLIFFRIAILRIRSQLDCKTAKQNWPWMGLLCNVSLEHASFCWLHINFAWNVPEKLKFVSFLMQ